MREYTLHIAADHPALAGHFPGQPIVPGVVLLDEVLHVIAQSAAVAPTAVWHIEAVKFHRIVMPGESLRLELTQHDDARWRFRLQAADAVVMSGSVTPA